MNKPLIISLAIDGREPYVYKQKGLIKTLPVAGDCDTWILNEYPEGVMPHGEVPYLFKYDLIQKAVDEDYKLICWADSSMRLLKNPFELLAQSKKGIVAFENIGHKAWKYTDDLAAYNLRQYYDDIYQVDQTWGGFFMMDFTKSYAYKILQAVFHQAAIGSFANGTSDREGFVSSRNDQTVLSYLFHFYKIPLLEYGIIASRLHENPKTYIRYGD